jgi:hypothetical protein
LRAAAQTANGNVEDLMSLMTDANMISKATSDFVKLGAQCALGVTKAAATGNPYFAVSGASTCIQLVRFLTCYKLGFSF